MNLDSGDYRMTTNSDILVHFVKHQKPLFVAFGGCGSAIGGIHVFEFRTFITRHFPDCNFVSCLDRNRSWYHKGIRGFSTDFQSTCENLEKLIRPMQPSRIISIGVSAGGYAALLFSCIVKIDSVLAFSPQIYLDRETREENNDHRWLSFIKQLYETASSEPFLDLSKFGSIPQCSNLRIVYGRDDLIDKTHVNKVRECWPHLEIIEVPGGHSCVKELKANGGLLTMINGTL